MPYKQTDIDLMYKAFLSVTNTQVSSVAIVSYCQQ